MKTTIYLFLLAWVLGGCGDFLEETSQNEIHPSTVSDMEKLLEGEAYFTADEGTLFTDVTDIFTDNLEGIGIGVNNSYHEEKDRLRYRYLWDSQMWEDHGYGEDISIWQKPYERIKGCNVILEYTDDMLGDEDEKAHLKGEAYFLRGFYYFYLTNFFGKPYNCSPETDLAVPLKLVTGVTDEKFHKNTVKECYDRIVEDLLTGAEMMRSNRSAQSTQLTRANYLTSYALLSRVYLYMENWDEAIRYADSVLLVRGDLLSMETEQKKIFSSSGNVETLWLGYSGKISGGYGSRYPYSPSEDLKNVYAEDKSTDAVDLRNGGYGNGTNYLEWAFHYEYDEDDNPLYYDYECYGIVKGAASGSSVYTGIHVGEIYLNRAEAYLRKYMAGEGADYAQLALNDLNKLRQSRFKAEGYVDKTLADFADDEALWSFYQRERRRELCGQGNHRWFDLKRFGMPRITHVWVDDDNGSETEYVLEEGDARYVLPIPETVVLRNPNLNEQ